MKPIVIAVLLIFTLTLSGCAGMSQTEQRTLSGAGIGAAGGALIGSMYAAGYAPREVRDGPPACTAAAAWAAKAVVQG